ncbi:MAG: hypothetical protein KBT46_09080 [Ruminococcus sp.]|nr:hypothetical protein [Candidatus Copronaster equi]
MFCSTLSQLADEYFETAKELDNKIAKYKKILKEEYRRKNYLKVYDIKRKLMIYYDQKRDVMTTAYKLKNYYENDEEASTDERVKVIC